MSDSIDQQFVEYVVKSLVGSPDAVSIERKIDEKGVLLTLTVDPEDLGRVIGKRGATAQSIRTLLRALGTKNEARYNLKIVDNGEPKPERQQKAEDTYDTPQDDDSWSSSSSDDSTSGDTVEEQPEESTAERTRRELDDLDDLDI